MVVLEDVAVLTAVFLLAALFLWPQVHYARQVSIMQAAFMAVGGYAAAAAAGTWHWSWFFAVAFAAGLGAIAGGLVAASTARVVEDRYALLTLGVQLVAFNAILVSGPVTGGPQGIYFLPALTETPAGGIAVSVLAAVVAAVGLHLMPHSWFGRHCRAIGDDGLLYEMTGGALVPMKAALGALAGAGAGAAGALLVGHLQVAEPWTFTGRESIALVAMVFLLPGRPLVSLPLACFAFAAIPEVLRQLGMGGLAAAHVRNGLFALLLVFAAFRTSHVPTALPGALPSREEA